MADQEPDDDGRLPCTEPAFFQCGAVELAEHLLGKFLYLSESKIKVRILETEAYPEGDEVFKRKFSREIEDRVFKRKAAGVVVPWIPPNAVSNDRASQLFITAGEEEDSGDVVLLRSCEPIQGRKEINKRRNISEGEDTPATDSSLRSVSPATRRDVMVGPKVVAQALGEEWQGNPALYREGGIQLFHPLAGDYHGWDAKKMPYEEPILRAKRATGGLGSGNASIDASYGALYRFGLETLVKHRYILQMKKSLE